MMEEKVRQELRFLVGALRGHLLYQRWLGPAGQRYLKIPGPEAARANAQLTLAQVRQELGECTRCKLSRSRRQIVFGTGNEKAAIVLVGEAPGQEEDIQGEPFVGKAGAKLNQILGAIQLNRQEVYITNVVKCRPPGNRNPQPDEMAACEPFLKRQLEVISPLFIVALGKFAAQTLLKTERNISAVRGKFYEYNKIRVLPTYHPAFLLRNPNMRRKVWEDFKLLQREYQALSKERK